MSRATIPPDLARQLGLDLKEEGEECVLVVMEKMGDGSVVVESDYEGKDMRPHPGMMDDKTPETMFSKALRKGTKYP